MCQNIDVKINNDRKYMNNSTKLFGRKIKQDWLDIRKKINQDLSIEKNWKDAVELIELRVETRYFKPIYDLIIKSDSLNDKSSEDDNTVMALSGEGFAVMTLICSLIEFLQSCYEGKEYIQNATQTDTVYGHSGIKFKSFLRHHKPFRAVFSQPVEIQANGINDFADDFYSNVRCGLLHEAATKDNWKIKVGDKIKQGDLNFNDKNFVDVSNEAEKIIYRNNFFGAIKSYFEDYKKKIIENKEENFDDGRGNRNINLRKGFCRKLDLLCNIPDLERVEKWWQ